MELVSKVDQSVETVWTQRELMSIMWLAEYTSYQSEDLGPTIPTYRQEEEKRKNSRRL